MYNPTIVAHFSNPKHSGELPNANQELKIGNSVCGDTIFLKLRIVQEKVEDAKFTAYGCATSLATADIFAHYIIGKQLSEIIATPIDRREAMLGELEPPQMHCLHILHELFTQLEQVAV